MVIQMLTLRHFRAQELLQLSRCLQAAQELPRRSRHLQAAQELLLLSQRLQANREQDSDIATCWQDQLILQSSH